MKIELFYMPAFIHQLDHLPHVLQEEALEKIEEFKDVRNHKKLRVHKLTGSLVGRCSFSVDYRNRIVFRWLDKSQKSAALLAVGDHDIYR